MGHADDAQIAMAGMGSGWSDDAFAFGSRPDEERADGCKDAELIWVETAVGEIRVWI